MVPLIVGVTEVKFKFSVGWPHGSWLLSFNDMVGSQVKIFVAEELFLSFLDHRDLKRIESLREAAEAFGLDFLPKK